MRSILLTIICITTTLSITSCHKDDHDHDDATPNQSYIDTASCSGVTASFNADIKPIFDLSCAVSGCHDAGTAEHSVVLDTYSSSVSSFENQNILCSINHGTGCAQMPHSASQLPSHQILVITCWAKAGFPE